MNRRIHRVVFAAAVILGPSPGALACTPNPYLGQLCTVAQDWCPVGTLAADGKLLPICGNEELFSLLGTNYGGDGQTTFAMPDLRGRVVVDRGQGRGLTDREMGQQLGALDLQVAEANLPPHDHPASSTADVKLTLRGQSLRGDSDDPSGRSFATLRNASGDTSTTTNGYSSLAADVDMDASAIKVSATVATTLGPAGGGQPLAFGNAQPTLVMTYCIVTNGIFPNYQ